jgi:serine/threonine protein phosphatase PrpC/CRP-like cAMP-binding protein
VQIKDAATVSEKGRGRQFNEDAVLYMDSPVLGAVADGIGGPGAGNVAASVAMVQLQKSGQLLARTAASVTGDRSSSSRLAAGRTLEKVVHTIHHDIHRAAEQQGKTQMMATLVAALVAGDRATIAHVGAARAYLYRQGRLRLLTEDHTLAMLRLRQGRMTAAEFKDSPLRRRLYQALGAGNDVDVDVAEVALADDDLLLLCSDGIYDRIEVDEIVAALDQPTAQAAVDELVRAARVAGAEDDLSAVVLRIGSETSSALLDDITEVLQETFLFRGLSDAERTLIAPYLEHTWLKPGEVLFREGEQGDAFYVVVDGRVRITRSGTHLVDVSAGGNFGELCLARPVPRSATVTAVQETLVFGLTRDRFQEVVRRKPALGARISIAALDYLGDRLRDLTERLSVVEGLANREIDPQGLDLPDAVTLAARGQFELP